jgi:hypothetical protein
MKFRSLALVAFAVLAAAAEAGAQVAVVINDPNVELPVAKLSPNEQGLFDKTVLPAVRKVLANEYCEEEVTVAGSASGAFTRAGSKQTLVFYQFCQTGNGLGSVGLAVLENGKVAANFVSAESAWSVDAQALPDINMNGLDEFALYYSGGMHQGEGGTGVDIMEFSAGKLKGIGWFQAESFSDSSPTAGYKVSVKPGVRPVFTREKFIQNDAGKWRRSGRPAAFKLTAVYGTFEVVK